MASDQADMYVQDIEVLSHQFDIHVHVHVNLDCLCLDFEFSNFIYYCLHDIHT